MTRHKHAHTGLVTPQLPQLLLTAALRLFAMLMSNVASTLRMFLRRPAVNATRQMPHALPEETTDIQFKEPKSVAVSDDSLIALILRDRRKAAIVSKDGGVLPARAIPIESFSGLSRESRLAQRRNWKLIVPLIPAKAGTQSCRDNVRDQRTPLWIPAFAGTSGDRSVRKATAPA